MNQVRAIEFAEYGVTNVHSVAIGFMAAMTALTLAPKRSAATFAILSVCIFMPMDQRLVVGGIDLSMLRLILMVGAARVVIRREHVGFSYGRLDRLVLWWVVSTCVIYLLHVGTGGRSRLDFDYLHPLRIATPLIPLWLFRSYYVGLRSSWSWTPVLLGSAVFVLWVAS